MPSAKLSQRSLLLSQAGWIDAATLRPGRHELLGVDRHGQPVLGKISISREADDTLVAYVGTAAMFGAFSEATRLVLHDGTRRRLKDVIEFGEIADLRFETFCDLPPENCRSAGESVWPILEEAAAARGTGWLALRCLTAPAAREPAPGAVFAVKRIGSHCYCVLRRRQFDECMRADFASTVKSLAEAWLANPVEDRRELERRLYEFALWYVAAMRIQGEGYRLSYDTLQHTALVFIAAANRPPGHVERGACAFFEPKPARTIGIAWEEPTWNPISSGFFIAAE